MTIDDWLAAACADADKRGLGELKPLLESLARSTMALRRADVPQTENAEQGPPEDRRT